MLKKTKWYVVYADDRKTNLQGYMLVRTDPKGGPYPYRWVNQDGVVQTQHPRNTHRTAFLSNDRVSFEYLHRRCRPAVSVNHGGQVIEAQFRIDLGVDTDTPQFIEDSPIKMGATYSPDAPVPAN